MNTNIYISSCALSLVIASCSALASEEVGIIEGGGVATMSESNQPELGNTTQQAYQQVLPLGIPMGTNQLKFSKQQSASGLGLETYGGKIVTPRVKITENNNSSTSLQTDSLYPSAGPCSTNTATGSAPPDIHGAAGPSRLVVVTNVAIGVYNKSGCTVAVVQQDLKLFFGTSFFMPAAETLFDPRVLYDQTSQRFFVTAESRNSSNTDQFQYFAVSTDSGATAWRKYRITLSSGTSRFCKLATNSFWDYPQAGVSSARWFIASNDFPASGSARGAIISIDKAFTLNGATPTAVKCFNNLEFNQAPPVVRDSSTTPVFLAPNTLNITKRTLTQGTAAVNDTLALSGSYDIPDWAIPPDAVQPNGQKLDSIDGRFQSASLQSRDRIWNIHTVASGSRPLIRWYRLQRSTNVVLNTVTFQSNGTSHLFNPSFVTNSGIDGSPAFITASRTEPTSTTCPSTTTNTACLASMLVFSGPNNSAADWVQGVAATSTTQFRTQSGIACNSTSRGSCRWGDYSSITVDPNSAGRAWGFNQLIGGTEAFNWLTRAREEVYNVQN